MRESRQTRVERLYQRFGPLVYSRCRRVLRDDALAEDAAQEVFVRLLTHLDAAPDDAKVVRWLHRIASNYCFNLLRDRGRQPELWDELPELPSAHLERELADRDLARWVTRSSPASGSSAWLHWVAGFDQREVAKLLGVSARTIHSRLKAFKRRCIRLAAA